MSMELTRADRESGFRRATSSMAGAPEHWAERARTGLTDKQLTSALAFELGVAGGQCGPDSLGLEYQGSGLKIWIAWEIGNHLRTPALEGAATIKMAREIYGIKDPSVPQGSLF